MSNIKTIAITVAATTATIAAAGVTYWKVADTIDKMVSDRSYRRTLDILRGIIQRGRVSEDVRAEAVRHKEALEAHYEYNIERACRVVIAKEFIERNGF